MSHANPISIMTFPFGSEVSEGKITLEALMAGFKQIGFDGVEVFLSDLRADDQSLGRYHSLLKNNDLKLSCIDAICDFVSSSPADRRKAVEHLHAGIATAGEFDCTRVMIAGSVLKEKISPIDGRKMIAEALASEADFAREAGVTLMAEDFGMDPNLMCKAADCLEVIRLAGHPEQVKFTFDTANFIFAGEDPAENLKSFLPVIHHVHIKSWRRLSDRRPGDSGEFGGYIGCPVGEGVIPNQSLAQRIIASGYKGWFSLECGALTDSLSTARRDYQALASWVK
jgi:sugar phosphate isomerase/epimerase